MGLFALPRRRRGGRPPHAHGPVHLVEAVERRLLLAVTPAGEGPAILPDGPEFRLEGFTFTDQIQPVIASAADGRFVAAWHDGSVLAARQYDATGRPLRPSFA